MINSAQKPDRLPSRSAACRIASAHEIHDAEELHEVLCDSAEIYFGIVQFRQAQPDVKASKRAFYSVQNAALKLQEKIEKLGEYEQKLLWDDLHGDARRNPAKNWIEALLDQIFLAGSTKTDPELVLDPLKKIGSVEAMEIVGRIRQSAEHWTEHFPLQASRGRKANIELLILMQRLQAYWSNKLSRSFTFDEHNGEGITPAYLFCCDAVNEINPAVTATEIKTQMRAIIAENRMVL